MSEILIYDTLKFTLHKLDTDDTIASAHGILCGFACVKPELKLEDWLDEIFISFNPDNPEEQAAYELLAQIFNATLSQLNDAELDFQLLIADEETRLSEQTNTLIEWCQGYLTGLGLQKIATIDEEVLEMIRDLSEIAKLDGDLQETEQNAQDLNEIIEFVRMGVLLIQETLQPSKQNYISPEVLH
jgi:yecA family protein